MSVALVNYALTSLDAVRVHLKRPSSWSQDEQDRVSRLINAYSRQIRKYTDRQFLPAENDVAKKFRYEGSGMLSLSPYELNGTPSAVTLYTDMPKASWLVLPGQDDATESRYRLEPRNATLEGTYLWMALPEVGMYSTLVAEPAVTRRARGHEVTVTGNWAVGSAPPDVELACIIAVANAFQNPSGFQSQSMGGMSFAEIVETQAAGLGEGLALPRDARTLLAEYKRTVYSVSG